MPDLQDPDVFRTVLDSLLTGVFLVGRDRKILFWNDGAEKITGYRRHEVLGRSCRENILPNCDEHDCALCGVACPLTGTIHEGKSCEAQVYFRHKAGHRVPVHVRAVPIRNRLGVIVGAAESFDEQSLVSEPNHYQNSLAAHGCLDLATGAMNHGFTLSHLRENLSFFAEYHLPFGILSIRVEELKRFRATHGREAADAILHVIAQTMKHTLGATGFLGRWTENEFLVIVPNCGSAEVDKAGESIQKIVSSSGIQWWGDPLSVTVSVGRAMVQPGDTVESILERAGRSFDHTPAKVEDCGATSGEENRVSSES